MTAAFIILCTIIFSLGIYWNVRSYKRHKLNLVISDELTRIIDETNNVLQENKKITEKQKFIASVAADDQGSIDLLTDPAVLGTIVTVLINKIGDTRLNMQDFMIPDSEFVSVYVDTETQEIILSLDPKLQKESLPSGLVGFGVASDDNTFH